MGYRGKVAERERARELRAQGWAMPDIAEALEVAKSSVSLWARDVRLPDGAHRATGRSPSGRVPRHREPNALQRAKEQQIEELTLEGRERIGTLSERDLLIAGTALYAGEGAKRDGEVAFSNTNARFMELFCRWIRTFFTIEEQRLRVRLYLHRGLDLEAATTHWAAVTQIPIDQFRTPYRAVADRTLRTTKHELGCATVTYGCTSTHRAVMGLVRALAPGQAVAVVDQPSGPPAEPPGREGATLDDRDPG